MLLFGADLMIQELDRSAIVSQFDGGVEHRAETRGELETSRKLECRDKREVDSPHPSA